MIVFYLTNMVSGGSAATTPANYVWAPVALAGASSWLAVSGWGTPTWLPVDTSVN